MEPNIVKSIKLIGPTDTGKTSLWKYISKGLRACALETTRFVAPGSFTFPLYEDDMRAIANKKVEFGQQLNVDEWVAGYMAAAKTDYSGLYDACALCNGKGTRQEDEILVREAPFLLVQLSSADVGGQKIYNNSLEEVCEYWIKEETTIFPCFKAEDIDRDGPDLLEKIGIIYNIFEECKSHIYNKPLALIQTQTDQWPAVPPEVHRRFREKLYPEKPDAVQFIPVNAVEMTRKEVMYNILAIALA